MSRKAGGGRGEAEHGDHIVPIRIYVGVFAALLVLTATTTLVSGIDLGPWNTVVALVIAFVKATLVVLFFMHIKYSPRLMQVVIAGGLLWLGIMIALTLSDFATRGWLRT
jgi:cytochrome c oxidase subunit IV